MSRDIKFDVLVRTHSGHLDKHASSWSTHPLLRSIVVKSSRWDYDCTEALHTNSCSAHPSLRIIDVNHLVGTMIALKDFTQALAQPIPFLRFVDVKSSCWSYTETLPHKLLGNATIICELLMSILPMRFEMLANWAELSKHCIASSSCTSSLCHLVRPFGTIRWTRYHCSGNVCNKTLEDSL